MKETNNEFADNINMIFESLNFSLLTAFELYVNNFLRQNKQLDERIGKERNLSFHEQSLAKELKKKVPDNDNVNFHKTLIHQFENENQGGDDLGNIIKKREILAEQAVVYCCSIFENFRVRLVELLFKNIEESKESYLRVFKEVASSYAIKTGDARYTKVFDKNAIKPENLKLIQNNNKFNSLEKQAFNIDLNNEVIKNIYENSFAAYIIFRELRNLLVHRKTKELKADEIFYDSIKRGVGSAVAQKKVFKVIFKNIMGFSWNKKDSIHLSPKLLFRSITHVLNLSHLYCFSIANKYNFYLELGFFNDVLIDFEENNFKHVYINFFMEETISTLHITSKIKNDEKHLITLVNFILASNVVKEAYADSDSFEFMEEKINFYLNALKERKDAEIFYDIVNSFINRDFIKLTQTCDKYLLKNDMKKANLFDWYIFKKLKRESFIERYLNKPLKSK